MNSRKQRFVKNIFFSIFTKIIIFVLGIIIPRLVILSYGSEANGLLSATNNIFTYIALIQAGIGTASVQALYKPITQDNKEKISEVIVATQNCFRKLLKWYFVAVLIFACVYPLVVRTTLSFWVIFGVIFVQGISHVLTYGFASTVCQLLAADGKDYVSQIVQLVVFCLNSVLKIALLLLGANLVVLQVAYLIVNVIQIVIYRIYVKRNYPWLNWEAIPDNLALGNRKRYMLNGVSWTVFNSTDTLLISIICGLKYSSIYAVYNLVFANLNTIIAMIYSSSYFVLGQTYHEDKNKYIKLHDGLESLVSAVSFACLTIAYVLILPFISLYTRGISDIQYVDSYLPILFCCVQLLSNCRLFSGNLINVCNRPDLTNKASVIETTMNLVLSVILAFLLGVHGVLIATVVALFYKTNFIIVVSNKKLLNRSAWKTYKILGTNFLLFFIAVIICTKITIKATSYFNLLIYAIIVGIGVFGVYIIVNCVTNKAMMDILKNFISKKR